MPRLPIVMFTLALNACNAWDAPQAANGATPANGYAVRIAALPAGQRNGVLIRAIRDADRDCQQVTQSASADEVEGNPAWSAVCDGRSPYIVAFGPDGVATVMSAPVTR